jgi:hypothetical protein
MAVGTVKTCDLHKAPYKAYFGLSHPYKTFAKTVKEDSWIGARLKNLTSNTDVSPSYVHLPRCVMFENGDENNYRTNILKLSGSASTNYDQENMKVLAKVFDPEIARSGVMFSGQYSEFHQNILAPSIQELKRMNYSNLEIHFFVSGIVKRCGVRAAFTRLFDMACLHPDAHVSIDESNNDPNKVEVIIRNGNLFSAALFLGMISPDIIKGASKAPRIFHGIDIGVGFDPYNFVVAAVNKKPIELPMGMFMYTINIDDVSEPKIFGLGGKRQESIAKDYIGVYSPIREAAHNFISSI